MITHPSRQAKAPGKNHSARVLSILLEIHEPWPSSYCVCVSMKGLPGWNYTILREREISALDIFPGSLRF